MELVEGKRAVYELLLSDYTAEKILIARNMKPSEQISKIEALAVKRGIRVYRVDRRELDQISSTHSHQGVIAETEQFSYLGFAEFAEQLDIASNPIVLMLDEITDPHNVGALLRTADAIGCSGIIVPKKRTAPISATVHKVSAGASSYIPIVQVSNLVYTIEELKSMGFWIVGASEHSNQLYYDLDLSGPLVIVLGSEGKGISRLLKEKCDFLAAIPMGGHIESLNVSVAGALFMYEAFKQRAAKHALTPQQEKEKR